MHYSDFEDYLATEYENIGNTEFYLCPGNHTWHINDIEDEWERCSFMCESLSKIDNTVLDYDRIRNKLGVTL